MTTYLTRADRPFDPADISSVNFWSGIATDRGRCSPNCGHAGPSPDDQGFWAVVRDADVVEVTRRPGDSLSGEGVTFESVPRELLDAAMSFLR